jgi:aldose 1-epimerase
MSVELRTLSNEFWQVGILPTVGASIAFGRVRKNGAWQDVLRPTAEKDYGNSSKASSFIMLPWCNRIKGGLLRFEGAEYQLETMPDDGTARHGDVRKRAWTISNQTDTSIQLALRSSDFPSVNWPFQFSARAEYALEGQDFVWKLWLKNEDTRRMPGGFGHHPYFVRPTGENAPLVEIPCASMFELVNYMAEAAPVPVPPRLDFRTAGTLHDDGYNDLLTHRNGEKPARLIYPEWKIALEMYADPIFPHILLYTPPGEPSVAIEPMSNASDGFNLYANGIPDSGVFVLEPGEEIGGEVRLQVTTL